MKTFLAGADVTVDVLFEQGADTVVPDVGSVTYSLYGNDGTLLDANVAVTTTTNSTQVAIPILAVKNTITGDFETRTLLVDYKITGGSRQQQVQYRLIPFVTLAVSPDDVRNFIGVSRKELPNDAIDIYGAYLGVVDDLGSDLVGPALVAKDATTTAINRAVICRALIEVLPSLQLRVLQSSKSNTAEVSRFAKIDFDELADWIWSLYYTALSVLDPEDIVARGIGLMAVVSTPTLDPITAAAPA